MIRYWSNPSSTPFGYSTGCFIVVSSSIAYLAFAVEALFLCPDSAGNAQCDSGFMPREYYRHRSVSLVF